MRKRNLYGFVPAALIMVCLASCLKTVTNNNNNNPAGVTFVNVVPNSPSFGVFLDGDSMWNSHNFPYATYDSNSDGSIRHYSVYAGIHSIAFKDSADNVLVGGETQFSQNTNYTIYLYDTLTTLGLNAVQLQDSFDSVQYGYSSFRFLNFSPNAPVFTISLTYSVDSLPILTNQAYVGTNTYSTATLSHYTTVVPGTYYISLKITNASGQLQAVDSVQETLVSGKAYTLVVAGLYDTLGVVPLKKLLIKMN